MLSSAPLVLPENVLIFAAHDLPAEERCRLSCAEDEYVVSRIGGRAASTLIDRESADLLEHFRQPRPIVEVVLRYSLERGLEPRDVLRNAWPMLRTLCENRVLMPEEESLASTGLLYRAGDEVAGLRILRVLQALEDTEVYLGRLSRTRGFAVLKVFRGSGDSSAEVWRREAEILRHLDGRGAPRLLEEGGSDGRHFLLLEWCVGVDSCKAADELRELKRAGASSRSDQLKLCTSVARAYADLHELGVLHGDVHPGNILVDGRGTVRLIDFGLSVRQGEPGGVPRGGVLAYESPERATALLKGKASPTLTARAEQYSVATLLYRMAAGVPYLEPAVERKAALEQIVHHPALPFVEQNRESWPELEQILARALAKKPSDRYASMRDLLRALEELSEQPAPAPVTAPSRGASRSRKVREKAGAELLAETSIGGPWWRSGFAAPKASISFGEAGVAYALYRHACQFEDPRSLAAADAWVERALVSSESADGFSSEELELSPSKVGRCSPFHTASGVAAVEALIAGALGDSARQAKAVTRFVSSVKIRKNWDLTLGRCGVLLVAAFLRDQLVPSELVEYQEAADSLRTLGDDIEREVWGYLSELDSIPKSGISNLGIAHGWAGFLYATLQWRRASALPVPGEVIARLDELRSLSMAQGRGVCWPWHVNEEKVRSMPGWCNGTAGHIFLWTLAARLLDREDYFDQATQAGWSAWETRDSPGSLCCGLVGRAYAMLNLYHHTEDSAWLTRAQALGDRAFRGRVFDSEYPQSLFRGRLSLLPLAADLEHPQSAAFPLFEEET